ncbi:MAG: transketolase C-terminal domain-containing protein [bacterium]
MIKQTVDIRDAFFDQIYNIAAKDKDVVFITADADAFSLRKFKKDFPDQFINVGVAEQNMVTVAAGLALSGKRVFIYAIIPFITLRCLEHIKVNICSMNLPVTIIGAGAGLSFGNDGATHHAIDDIAIMRILPEITIFNPIDDCSAAASAQIAYESGAPAYVRLDKGVFNRLYSSKTDCASGYKVLKAVSDVNVLSTGFMTHVSIKAAGELKKEFINIGIIDVFRLKPINKELFLNTIAASKQLISFEENSIVGGLGTIISEILIDNWANIQLKRIALKDRQCFDYGTREWLHDLYNVNKQSLIKIVKDVAKK